MAIATEIVGDRWSLLILREAFYGVIRYDDMLADLGVPRSMLTDRLARLVKHGLLTRQPYQEPGSRVRHAYVLTESGRALGLTLIALSQWGETHMLDLPAPVEFVEKMTRKPVRAALVDENGATIELKDVVLRLRA